MAGMILGYHVILGAYGFWLPNDPRGSWSEWVGSWELFRYGPATKTDTRRSVAATDHDRDLRRLAKNELKYPPVIFTGVQARTIALAMGRYAREHRLTIWACAMLPEHLHLVVARTDHRIESTMNHLKGAATRALDAEGIHPLREFRTCTGRLPKAFARGGWAVYLDSWTAVERAVRYVQDNPCKEGKRPQAWSFVRDWRLDV